MRTEEKGRADALAMLTVMGPVGGGRGDGRGRERLDDELESEGGLMSVDGCWVYFLIR